MKLSIFVLTLLSLAWEGAWCLSLHRPSSKQPPQAIASTLSSRRSMLNQIVGATAFGVGISVSAPSTASAAADCFKDCVDNCKKIAPKDPDYCTMNCKGYCEQDNRTDGLSGSVSSQSGEVGILGGSFGQGTVTKSDDRPPSISLPGLDFSSANGRKLLGY